MFEAVVIFTDKIMGLCSELAKGRASKKKLDGNGTIYRKSQETIEATMNAMQIFENENAEIEGVPPRQITLSKLSVTQKNINGASIHPFNGKTFTLSSVGFLMFRSKLKFIFQIKLINSEKFLSFIFFLVFCLKDDFSLPTIQNDISSPSVQRSSMVELKWLYGLKSDSNGLYNDLIFGRQAFLTNENGKKLYLDGYSPSTKTAFEFLGCYSHGCKICNNDMSKFSRYEVSFRDLREMWDQRLKTLKEHRDVRHVNFIWECQYR